MNLPSYDHTSTLLEDVFEIRREPHLPVVVFDFKVAAHFIVKFAEMAFDAAGGEDNKTFRDILKAMWAYRLNRGPDMLPQMDFVALIADDHKAPMGPDFAEASEDGKGYWRHIEAHKLGLEPYKGGRGEKSPLFPAVQEEGYAYITSKSSTFKLFSKPFFEADDIAGYVCRLKREAGPNSKLAQRQVFLYTVDGDWQGLVSDSHGIYWANTGPWLPRLRSEREVCDYYLRKERMEITTARGCYDFKAKYGDRGDNLAPGTPLRFFDLYEPDHEWRFTEEDCFALERVLNSDKKSNNQAHLESSEKFLKAKGLFLPSIPPTSEEDKQTFFTRADRSRRENSHPELKGRGRTKCMAILDDTEIFEKCKKLMVEDTELLNKIKEEQDKEIIKTLKLRRKEIKECICEIFNMEGD